MTINLPWSNRERAIGDWTSEILKNGLVTINRKGGVRCAAACFFGEWKWGENAEKRAVVLPRVHMSVVGIACVYRVTKGRS